VAAEDAQLACTLGTLVIVMELRQIERIVDELIKDGKDLRRTLAAAFASRV
jgi:siroheme synthase